VLFKAFESAYTHALPQSDDLRKAFAPTREDENLKDTLLLIDILSITFSVVSSGLWNNVSTVPNYTNFILTEKLAAKVIIRKVVAKNEEKIKNESEAAAKKVKDKYKDELQSDARKKEIEKEAEDAKDKTKKELTEVMKKKESGVDTLKDWVRLPNHSSLWMLKLAKVVTGGGSSFGYWKGKLT
jgi:hypothetical protein